MAQPQEFPFNIMDVAELLHLHIRRRQADSVYADCPICGDKRGKMNINFAKNLWRCNYCNEGGGNSRRVLVRGSLQHYPVSCS